jgi:hypothetical protein
MRQILAVPLGFCEAGFFFKVQSQNFLRPLIRFRTCRAAV